MAAETLTQQAASPEHPTAGTVRELRLAVVLYGGVSLAIYMHGTTKELHRLVKASALEDRGATESDADTPSERVYRRLLRGLSERQQHVRTRVVVDVISGTSAGGINGVYLAKALAHNLPQNELRDVWLDRGDVSALLRGWHALPWPVRAATALRKIRKRSALDGEAMSRWLYQALAGMDSAPRSPQNVPTLMPERHDLELFVTATDFSGYDRKLRIDDPPLVHDAAHRHVLRFRHAHERDDFGQADNGWLAFSARATSSFPAAFAPVSPHSFEEIVRPEGGMPRPERFFRIYDLSHAPAVDCWFVDGGVLDNRPFGQVVRAIRERPADTQVDRRLIYLEPDPSGPDKPARRDQPSPVATALGALSGIPRQQPILDEILELTRHNERVDRLRDIIEMSFAGVEARVRNVLGGEFDRLGEAPTAEDLARWNDELHDEAREASGTGWPTYLRSKVSSVVDRYAGTVCALSDYPEDCSQAAFVRSVLRAWARERLFTERDGRVALTARHAAFLRRFDLDYGARRLRFTIDALSWWYEPEPGDAAPSRAQLDRAKRALYAKRDVLTGAMAGHNLGRDLTDRVLACFEQGRIDEWPGPPADYAGQHAEELLALERGVADALEATLAGFGASVFAATQEITRGWNPATRQDLRVRYLGFPIWDAILFPVQSVADAGERDHVEVTRFSPLDATRLKEPPKRLAGASLGHFGAFFTRAGRERDYLWGRLDGAERLIGLLVADPDEAAGWCREAFGAIVEEEQGHLDHARDVLDAARQFAGD